MQHTIVKLLCITILACGAMSANAKSTPNKQPAPAQVAAPKTDVQRLHDAIMLSELEDSFSSEAAERKVVRMIEQKIQRLPPAQRKALQEALNSDSDPSGMGKGLFYYYAFMLDTWHKNLRTMPALKTPEYEAVRQKWLTIVQYVENEFWQSKAVDFEKLVGEFNAFFKQHGLQQIP